MTGAAITLYPRDLRLHLRSRSKSTTYLRLLRSRWYGANSGFVQGSSRRDTAMNKITCEYIFGSNT